MAQALLLWLVYYTKPLYIDMKSLYNFYRKQGVIEASSFMFRFHIHVYLGYRGGQKNFISYFLLTSKRVKEPKVYPLMRNPSPAS